MAFFRSRKPPNLSFQLVVAAAAGRSASWPAAAQASSGSRLPLPGGRVSLRPGRRAAGSSLSLPRREGRTRVILVDSETGSMQGIPLPNGIIFGLGWLNGESLVINQSPQIGSPIQLFRLSYPAGQVTRLTNDPNDYVGASLTADGGGLVTARSEARMDIWVGDARGTTGTDVVRRAPSGSIFRVVRRSAVVRNHHRRPARHHSMTPGRDGTEEVVLDALTPASPATAAPSFSCRRHPKTFSSSGRRMRAGAGWRNSPPSATAGQIVVTPDDRSVIYTSVVGETASIWMVPLDGGTPTKLVDGAGVSVSPDGRRWRLPTPGRRSWSAIFPVARRRGASGPRHSVRPRVDAGRPRRRLRERRQHLGPVACRRPAAAAHAVHRQPSDWSPSPGRGTERLAISRSTLTNDIVLFKGLK